VEDILRELDKIEKEIGEAKNDIARAEGELKGLFRALKEEFGVDSLEKANRLLEIKVKEKETLNPRILDRYKELKETYQW